MFTYDNKIASAINQSVYEMHAFSLNDLTFGEMEVANADLANVMPSMNEIFPQTIDMIDVLYGSVNNDNLHQF